MSEDNDEGGGVARSIMDGLQTETGAKPYCMRGKRCVRAISCEHVQARGRTVDVQDLFKGRATDFNDCSNWTPRKELNTNLDVPRRRSGSGSRHNSHADRDAAYRELLGKIERGEPIPNSPYTPEQLKAMLEESRRRRTGNILKDRRH